MASKEEKREDILKAAIRVISDLGFERTKIEDIAKEAGIGKGTVYEYFESKNTLFMELIRYCIEQLNAGIVKAFADGDNILAKIRNLSVYFTEFFSKHMEIANSMLSGHPLAEEMKNQMTKDWAVINKTIEDEIRAGIRDSEIRANVDPEMAVAVIVGGLEHYIMKKLCLDQVSPEEVNHDGIAKVILTGLVW